MIYSEHTNKFERRCISSTCAMKHSPMSFVKFSRLLQQSGAPQLFTHIAPLLFLWDKSEFRSQEQRCDCKGPTCKQRYGELLILSTGNGSEETLLSLIIEERCNFIT